MDKIYKLILVSAIAIENLFTGLFSIASQLSAADNLSVFLIQINNTLIFDNKILRRIDY